MVFFPFSFRLGRRSAWKKVDELDGVFVCVCGGGMWKRNLERGAGSSDAVMVVVVVVEVAVVVGKWCVGIGSDVRLEGVIVCES